MPDLRIGNTSLSVEGIRELKADVKVDNALKNQLAKDGFDEIIFQKGDKLFIAYQKNMDLSKIQLNLEAFDEDSAYDAGQLSMNGDAVKVLHVDDENKESFWAAPYKSAGRAVTSLVNNPFGKSAIIGFVAGSTATVVAKTTGSWNEGPTTKLMTGVMIGTLGGTTAAGLKAGQESNKPAFWDTGAGIGAGAVGYGVGILATNTASAIGAAAINNPKVTAITLGVTAAIVGTGIALDMVADNNKPSTYRVINKISAH